MQKKIISLILGLAAIILGFFIQQLDKTKGKQVAEYDRSIAAIEGQPIKALRVIDGDTIELINGQKLRYIGIDTPEEVDERKPVQCFAIAAAEKNRELVEGKMIMFYKDVSKTDLYSRLLGFVYLEDGTFVNLEMVKQGYAFAYSYPPDISKSGEFRSAEEQARNAKLGLWNSCSVYKTSSGREQTNSVQ